MLEQQRFDLAQIDDILAAARLAAARVEAADALLALRVFSAAESLRAELISARAELDESEEMRERMAERLRDLMQAGATETSQEK